MWDSIAAFWNYPLITLSSGAVIAVDQVVLVAILVTAGIVTSRWIERAVGRRLTQAQLQPDAVLALRRVLFYFLVGVIAVTALGLLRVPLTAFAFVSGAVAIGVGFGAQNIINNFISGWILMSERPVRIGDFIEVEDSHGTVEVIGNRSTRIRRVDGVHMLVPNSLMLERTVVNWTLIDMQVRSQVRVGVAYGSPVREVEEIIYRAVREQAAIKEDPPPTVYFEDFGDSALIFDVMFWSDVSSERDRRKIRSDVRFRIDELFAENGITIAFPQRDLHIDSLRPVQIELVGSGATRPSAGG